MAEADFDITGEISQTRPQTSRETQIPFTVDFSTINGGSGLAAGESVDVFNLPDGYVHDYVVPICLTAEGEAATLDIGDEADPDGFGDGVDMNGTPDVRADLAWTEAYLHGEYFPEGTTVRLTCPGGANTIDVAKYQFIFKGFMID